METRTYSAIVHREGDLFVATCPEIGTVSQGETLDEALSNLTEATELYLEEFPAEESTRAFLTTFEVRAHA
ncbi:MAG: type II toxin-antitoxin system HicB family antitoxin [Deltaproteobacteria bacterium]|nr:type II toxin-antitoxin system HicB family antitoxin [Deltaproteobacteria bacterium]